MKTFRLSLLAIVAAIAIVPTIAQAQTTQTQTLISFRSGTVSQTVATPKATLHDLFGRKGLNLDLWGFGGFQLTPGQPLTGGGAASFHWQAAREVSLDLGLYGRAVLRDKLDGGIFLGVGLSF